VNRDEVIQALREHREEMKQRFGVKMLALFGSMGCGEATTESDIDILVEFEKPPGFDGYMDLKAYLEKLLERRVDLVMKTALKPWARPAVEEEAIDLM